MNKIYKVVGHDTHSSDFVLGTYSSYEKAEEAIQWIVNCSSLLDPVRFDALEFYEIEEYQIDLRPGDARNGFKTRSLYFDYEGNFISEYITEDGRWDYLCLGHIDCGQRLEVFEREEGEINVRDEETEGEKIYASLYLFHDEPYAEYYNNKSPLSDEQIRAVMNLLRGPCRNKLFRTNWDLALMYWSTDIQDGSCVYLDLDAVRKGNELPDTEEFIRNCNYKH